MKKSIRTIILLISLLPLFSMTVDGSAFLEGETDHSGIEVFLQRVAPDTNFRDTLSTNISGYYSVTVDAGWYEAEYYKNNQFTRDTVISINAYSDFTIENVTLVKSLNISGNLSGIISAGEYDVTGSISVETADTLIIEPGVSFKFYQDTEFNVYGSLIALGTDIDSIKFYSTLESTWEGINISDSSFCQLSYCAIENSVSSGIFVEYSYAEISNCNIRNNSDPEKGGGIYILRSDDTIITDTNIENNILTGNRSSGGGVYILDANNVSLVNCNISGNSNDLSTTLTAGMGLFLNYGDSLIVENCIITNNFTTTNSYSAGGVYIANAGRVDIIDTEVSNNITNANGGGLCIVTTDSVYIENCKIDSNQSSLRGGGVYIYESNVDIKNSRIDNNISDEYGGGIYSETGNSYSLDVKNSIFRGNYAVSGGGLYFALTNGVINNCILDNNSCSSNGSGSAIYVNSWLPVKIVNTTAVNNHTSNGTGATILVPSNNTILYALSNCIIANNIGYGVSNGGDVTNIKYNTFYNNSLGEFLNCGDYIGVNVTTNTNDDPCDAFGNISMNPMLDGDLRLQSGSPCIDTGTNTIVDYEFPIGDLEDNYRIWDGDGNGSEIVDMGAYEYGATSDIENEQLTIHNYILHQNYPNPFNPETMISYSLMNNAQVNLKVYDIAGREISNLVDQKKNKGSYEVKFNGLMLTSGIYFYSLSVDGKIIANKKMMLLK